MTERPHLIEEMSGEECVALLEAHHFGRIGVVLGGDPVIFPVNYTWADGRVSIRTSPGSKLAGADLANVAFEIDAVDDEARTGWSVIVKGIAFDVTMSIDDVSEQIRRFPVDTWAPGERASWIRIEPGSVTGRRIRPV